MSEPCGHSSTAIRTAACGAALRGDACEVQHAMAAAAAAAVCSAGRWDAMSPWGVASGCKREVAGWHTNLEWDLAVRLRHLGQHVQDWLDQREKPQLSS